MAAITGGLEIVDQVHHDLGLQLKQIAAIIGADESTLHRWLSGMTPNGPRKVYLSKLSALQELYTELTDAFNSLDASRRWLWESHPAPFSGKTPVEMLLAGKMERVTALLWSLNNGMPT
jgi:hypothetical protein